MVPAAALYGWEGTHVIAVIIPGTVHGLWYHAAGHKQEPNGDNSSGCAGVDEEKTMRR